MLEIFITVVAAVAVGAILVKYWRPILACLILIITIVISLVISIPVYIIKLPANLILACTSDEYLEETIVRTYDEMFYEASNHKELAKCRRAIKRMQSILRQREEKK